MSKDRFFVRRHDRPPPDDLESLRGWAARIDHHLQVLDANPHSWRIYRPDPLADAALIRFSADYPEPIRQLRESVNYVDRYLDELEKDDLAAEYLTDGMYVLMRRIELVADMIVQRRDSTVSHLPGGKQPERARRRGRKKANYETEQREA